MCQALSWQAYAAQHHGMTEREFGLSPPNPWKLFCHRPQQSQNFPRSAHREEIHTLDSITASGGAGLLRMMLSPLCTGKIICKYNTYTHSSQLLCTWLSITQIPLI